MVSLRKDCMNRAKVAIPPGDLFVIETFDAYRESWYIWGFASNYREAQDVFDHAHSTKPSKVRIRGIR